MRSGSSHASRKKQFSRSSSASWRRPSKRSCTAPAYCGWRFAGPATGAMQSATGVRKRPRRQRARRALEQLEQRVGAAVARRARAGSSSEGREVIGRISPGMAPQVQRRRGNPFVACRRTHGNSATITRPTVIRAGGDARRRRGPLRARLTPGSPFREGFSWPASARRGFIAGAVGVARVTELVHDAAGASPLRPCDRRFEAAARRPRASGARPRARTRPRAEPYSLTARRTVCRTRTNMSERRTPLRDDAASTVCRTPCTA